MDLLGVPRGYYYFLGYPDGETDFHICGIVRRLRQLILRIRPTRVYVPAYEGGHIDHDIANVATDYALKEAHWSCRVEEFPLYSAFNFVPFVPFWFRNLPSSPPTRCRRLNGNEYDFVLEYWGVYESQQFPLDSYLTLFPGHRVVFGWEYLRDLPHYNYMTEPDGGPVAYERFLAGVSFKDFQNAVQKVSNGCSHN
jgi:hypothetical protein